MKSVSCQCVDQPTDMALWWTLYDSTGILCLIGTLKAVLLLKVIFVLIKGLCRLILAHFKMSHSLGQLYYT